jgi:bifunctional DNA-binding transcriptional regulator/antitoxin component of YhaV-PrlF toxin-antitoxin module
MKAEFRKFFPGGHAMTTMTVQIRRKGVITLPVEMRRRYGLDEGDVFTLADLGDGSFLLTPRVSQVARLGDQVARVMAEEGVDLEEMLEVLDQERELYYQEHYVQA